MMITCVGGGPAGLTFAILAARGGHDVTVVERTPPEESFGWGVVFWDDLLEQLQRSDPETAALLRDNAYQWVDQDVTLRRQAAPVERTVLPSAGYSLHRARLLLLLRDRASAVGVKMVNRRYQVGADPETLHTGDADLLVASDGVNSGIRRAVNAHDSRGFGTTEARRSNKYIWLGTDKEFTSFTFPFVQTDAGWMWVHAYGFGDDASTFAVETTRETWQGLGFDSMGPAATMSTLESIFDAELDGHHLHPQAGTRDTTPWGDFLQITNERWHCGRVILMGDAAHTTHFSIGSGTRLAMEDAMVLAETLAAEPTIDGALAAYEARRKADLASVQREADASAAWMENIDRYVNRPIGDFAKLLDGRRSPAMPKVPVGLYVGLMKVADRLPAFRRVVRRLVRGPQSTA